ncbi:MAG TPA: alpha/beta hydrolase [Bryobacteraceae bacterium]|nr:alpha/beta hydrolase [Bryobacteraceae bacterium]
MLRRIALSAIAVISLCAAAEPKTELLWPGGAPGAVGEEDRDRPSLTIWRADQNVRNGTAVIVCPGGGYGTLAMDHEGKQVAEFLNRLGISAFVLKYRLGPRYRYPAPLNDAQRAIRTVRSRAREFGVAPDRVGIMGFSAGGHLASTAATHFDAETRPDFAILAYPVISFDEYAHAGSRRNLLGEAPDPKLVESLSNYRQVTAQTPPTFLFHTDADTGVPPENSILFYMALRKAKVPAELHIIEKGRHGVGLAANDPILSMWPNLLANWFKSRGLLTPAL